jgi:hypothetical protein
MAASIFGRDAASSLFAVIRNHKPIQEQNQATPGEVGSIAASIAHRKTE